MNYSTLPYDTLHQVCWTLRIYDFSGLKVFSQTDKQTRSTCIPLLFQSVAYIGQWAPEKIQWEGLAESIKALKQNPAILGAVQNIHIKPWVGSPEQRSYPKDFFDLIFSEGLDSFTELGFSIQKECTEQVESTLHAFHNPSSPSARPIIPTVIRASIRSCESLFLLEHLPALTSLEITESEGLDEEFDFAKIAALCPSLTRFHCSLSSTEEVVTGEGVKKISHEYLKAPTAVARHLPNIIDLGFSGIYDGKSGKVDEHMKAFSELKHLETLTLPLAMFIEPGDDYPWFGFGWCCESDSDSGGDDEEDAAQWERDTTKVEHQAIGVIERDVIALPGCTLSRVILARPNYKGQTVWEKGSDGRLLKSKLIE